MIRTPGPFSTAILIFLKNDGILSLPFQHGFVVFFQLFRLRQRRHHFNRSCIEFRDVIKNCTVSFCRRMIFIMRTQPAGLRGNFPTGDGVLLTGTSLRIGFRGVSSTARVFDVPPVLLSARPPPGKLSPEIVV